MTIFGNKEAAKRASVIEEIQVQQKPAAAEKKVSKKTIVGEGVIFVGNFTADEDIEINGKLEGDVISSKELIIGKKGKHNGKAVVNDLVVSGYVNLEAEVKSKTVINSTGEFTGNLKTDEISAVPGAVFNGNLQLSQKKANAAVRNKANEESDIHSEV